MDELGKKRVQGAFLGFIEKAVSPRMGGGEGKSLLINDTEMGMSYVARAHIYTHTHARAHMCEHTHTIYIYTYICEGANLFMGFPFQILQDRS